MKGQPGNPAFHKIRCKLCGYQGAPGRPKRAPHFHCPHCGHALVLVKAHADFDVWKCQHHACPYRRNPHLRRQALLHGANPKAKAYHFRAFHLPLSDLQLTRPHQPKVDFVRLRHSSTTVTLALTLHIHCGLSLRETAFWLGELFGVPVSH